MKVNGVKGTNLYQKQANCAYYEKVLISGLLKLERINYRCKF